MIAAIEETLGISTLAARILATVALILSVFGVSWGALHIHDNKVIARRDAQIDGVTTHATRTIRSSSAASIDPRVRGIIDPTTKE